jgi:transposase
VVRTGCSWRQLPADYPPWQTVYWYFVRWEEQNATVAVLDALRDQLRAAEGRDRQPSAGLIDSQSVKGADTVGRDSRGYDAGKKINGRKRFIVTDTLGLLLVVVRGPLKAAVAEELLVDACGGVCRPWLGTACLTVKGASLRCASASPTTLRVALDGEPRRPCWCALARRGTAPATPEGVGPAHPNPPTWRPTS